MLLVGSKALQAYLPLNRIIHDIDLWMTNVEFDDFNKKYVKYKVKETPYTVLYDVLGSIVEVKPESKFTPNDKKIFQDSLFLNNRNIYTDFGEVRVPNIQTIYDMKKATALCIDEWKHHYDLNLIESNYNICQNTDLFLERLKETKKRIEKSKNNKFSFFHKNQLKDQKIATIPEYIEHDYLHEIVSDLLNMSIPTYKKIICADTDVSEKQFNKLSYAEKISLMVEETLVLCLERWIIPQMIENGINYRITEEFYNNNEASTSYLILKHVNIRGLIGEKPYITQFGRNNFNQIEKMFFWAKNEIKHKNGFPIDMYNRVFDLRRRYKVGEKVGLHNKEL